MRYGFVNNFSQTITADISEASTGIGLGDGAVHFSDAGTYHNFPLTLFDDDGNIEIVHAKGSGDTWVSVSRGQEGTTARAWPAGTKIESRFTALVANGLAWGEPSATQGSRSVSIQPDRASTDLVASGADAVAIGRDTKASADSTVAIGNATYATFYGAVSIGVVTRAEQEYAIAIGEWAKAISPYVVMLGARTEDYGGSDHGVALGHLANLEGLGSIGIGHGATTWGAGQVALGPKAYPNQIQSALDVTAVPVMRDSIQSPQSYQHETAMRVTLPGLLRSNDIDMTTTGDKDSIDLPANTVLMVDRIETVVIASAESGSTPTVSIGTTLGGAEILSGHVMAGDTVLSREQLVADPLDDAVTALYFKVDSEAAASMTVRFIVHGYVMEI